MFIRDLNDFIKHFKVLNIFIIENDVVFLWFDYFEELRYHRSSSLHVLNDLVTIRFVFLWNGI
jgi:hypothetical protein